MGLDMIDAIAQVPDNYNRDFRFVGNYRKIPFLQIGEGRDGGQRQHASRDTHWQGSLRGPGPKKMAIRRLVKRRYIG